MSRRGLTRDIRRYAQGVVAGLAVRAAVRGSRRWRWAALDDDKLHVLDQARQALAGLIERQDRSSSGAAAPRSRQHEPMAGEKAGERSQSASGSCRPGPRESRNRVPATAPRDPGTRADGRTGGAAQHRRAAAAAMNRRARGLDRRPGACQLSPASVAVSMLTVHRHAIACARKQHAMQARGIVAWQLSPGC